jgi:uroporphyrinogen decarboxylase
MSSRERVRTALNHQEPDRVPFILGGCTSTTIMIQAYQRLKRYLGIENGNSTFMSLPLQVVNVEEKVLRALDIDIRVIAENSPSDASFYDPKSDIVTDEWGVKWQRPAGSLYYDICNAPLSEATVDDLETYPWPDPDHPERVAGVPEKARDIFEHMSYAVYADIPGNNIFEYAWYLRGLEQFMMDLIINKEFVHALLRKVTDIQKQRALNFLSKTGKYIDILRTSDDLAHQTSLFLSPALYREMIKPYQKEFFTLIKENSEAKILYHCCGAIFPLVPDIIDIGVDILNPVQVSCEGMNSAKLKEEFGTQLCFCGAIDSQHILPNGTPQDVDTEVRKRIADLAPGGGYLLAAVHNIQADVPAENIVQMFDSGKKYGSYPIERNK